ncbi:MAG: archease [Acidobacteriota bacterium]
MYEIFEHTADLGLRITAPDLNSLFAQTAEAFFSLIVENLSEVHAEQQIDFQITGEDKAYLLFDWLNELLYTFDTRHLLLCQYNVEVDETGLRAQAWGEKLDINRHQLDHEIKAITYHELKVEQISYGWQAEVIVDI